jgi:hypothetical protein
MRPRDTEFKLTPEVNLARLAAPGGRARRMKYLGQVVVGRQVSCFLIRMDNGASFTPQEGARVGLRLVGRRKHTRKK